MLFFTNIPQRHAHTNKIRGFPSLCLQIVQQSTLKLQKSGAFRCLRPLSSALCLGAGIPQWRHFVSYLGLPWVYPDFDEAIGSDDSGVRSDILIFLWDILVPFFFLVFLQFQLNNVMTNLNQSWSYQCQFLIHQMFIPLISESYWMRINTSYLENQLRSYSIIGRINNDSVYFNLSWNHSIVGPSLPQPIFLLFMHQKRVHSVYQHNYQVGMILI